MFIIQPVIYVFYVALEVSQTQTGRNYHRWTPSRSKDFFDTFKDFLSGKDPSWPSK